MREADKSGGQEKEGEPLAARSIRCQHCRGSARTRDRIMDGTVRRASEADAEVLTLLNTDVQKPGRLPEALADVFPALDLGAIRSASSGQLVHEVRPLGLNQLA